MPPTQHQYSAALFWADKAVVQSDGLVQDVFWLAQTYFHTGQFARASFLLKSRGLPPANLACRYLAAKCQMESKEWETAMEILGDAPAPGLRRETVEDTPGITEYEPLPHVHSSLSLLRGLVLEALDNRSQAVEAYTEALYRNVNCFEALDRLMSHHLLTATEGKLDPFTLPCRPLFVAPPLARPASTKAVMSLSPASRVCAAGGPPFYRAMRARC